jgi:DNA-binding NarL/FixJ family response regulator
MTTTVAYLTNDLMFSSRVRSLAQAAGIGLEVVGSREALRERIESHGAAMVLVDLDHRDANMQEIMAEVSQQAHPPVVLAYASHVKESLLSSAAASGCQFVLSRGQFDKQIGAILQSLLRGQADVN